MIKNTVIIFIAIFITSCASLLNEKGQKIKIMTSLPATVVIKDDSLLTNNNEVCLSATRNRDSLMISVIRDSLVKRIQVSSNNAFAYWLNIYPSMGLGFLVDKNNPKRFAYPSLIYVDLSDTTNSYYTLDVRQFQKGSIDMRMSFPSINSFLLKPEDYGYKYSTGFVGLSLGTDYYYSKQNYISFTLSGVMNNEVPAPVGVDRWGGYWENFLAAYIGLSNNFVINRFRLGYGLSYSKVMWNSQDYDLNIFNSRKSDAIGLLFPMYYQLSNRFFAGIVYRPTFIQLRQPHPLRYEHIISVDFGWRYSLNKKNVRQLSPAKSQ